MADTVKLTVDGVQIEAAKGKTVIEAARDAGVYIPYLCWHPILKPYGACRMCVVEVDKMRGTPAACTTQVMDGMAVSTNTEQVKAIRKDILELLLSEHPHGCLTCHRIKHCGIQDICLRNVSVIDRCVTCPQNMRCELQDAVYYTNMQPGISLRYEYRKVQLETRNPFIDHDMNLCIVCGRCVRTCNELEGVDAIAFVQRGDRTLIGTSLGGTLSHSGCTFCGSCADVCPVGAIVEKDSKWKGHAEQTYTTVCSYCPVGCQINLQTKKGKVMRAAAEFSSPTSKGHTCIRGKFGERHIQAKERLAKPLVRKNGQLVEASWDEAVGVVASAFGRHKGASFAALSLGKATNEEHYLLQKFARGVMGSNNVDHFDRISPPETLTPLIGPFGMAAMTGPVEDLGRARAILLIDSDTTSEHPVLGARLRKLHQAGVKLIAVDPRETELAMLSSAGGGWLRPVPGTEPLLVATMLKAIIDGNLFDKEFVGANTTGLEELRASLAAVTLADAAKSTGVPQERIAEAAKLLAATKPATIIFATGLGLNGLGAALTQAVLDLALLTGNVGKPGAGLVPLRGENNSQGASDLGVDPTHLPGYKPVKDSAARSALGKAWGLPVPEQPGLRAAAMLDAARKGQVRAMLVVAGGNHLASLTAPGAYDALDKLECLVVQDMFMSDLAKRAHVVLPVASPAEVDGSYTNMERRVQRVQKAVEPPGEAKPGWWVTAQIAQRMGVESFSYQSASQVADEIAKTVPAYAGVSLAGLIGPGVQSPPLALQGKGALAAFTFQPAKNGRFAGAPLVAFASLFREIDGEKTLDGHVIVELNEDDAAAQRIAEGDLVEVASEFGSAQGKAKLSPGVPRGVVYVTYPYTETNDLLLHKVAPPTQATLAEVKVAGVKVAKAAAVPVG